MSNDTLILVVDDDELLREAIAYDFRKLGAKVMEAASGNSAFEVVENNDVSLVVSDIRMPDGDGFELLKKLRTRGSEWPKVFLVTGFADVSSQQCLDAGASQVFQKPFDRKALIQSVLAALAR